MSTHTSTRKLKTKNIKPTIKFNENDLNLFYIKATTKNKKFAINTCSFARHVAKKDHQQDQYLFKLTFNGMPNTEITCYISTWNTESLNTADNIILHNAKIIMPSNDNKLTMFKILFEVLEDIIRKSLRAKSITYTIARTSQQRHILLALLSRKYKIINKFRNKNTNNGINILHKSLTRKIRKKTQNVQVTRTIKTKSK